MQRIMLEAHRVTFSELYTCPGPCSLCSCASSSFKECLGGRKKSIKSIPDVWLMSSCPGPQKKLTVLSSQLHVAILGRSCGTFEKGLQVKKTAVKICFLILQIFPSAPKCIPTMPAGAYPSYGVASPIGPLPPSTCSPCGPCGSNGSMSMDRSKECSKHSKHSKPPNVDAICICLRQLPHVATSPKMRSGLSSPGPPTRILPERPRTICLRV